MSKNKEYRLKRKSLRKDYIIQDKNLKIKTLYYRNETKRNKIEQLQQENKILRENAEHNDKVVDKVNWENRLLKGVIDEVKEYIKENRLYNYEYDEEELFEIITDKKAKQELLQILDKVKENKNENR